MWAAVYFLHAFVAAGLFTIGAAVLWPALVNQPASVRMLPMLAGIVVGLLLAERSRRAGSLLTKRRR
jgi:hypothetical protein